MSVTQASLLGDAFGSKASGTIPIGGIIMWSGTIANIPTGWLLCNGSNGTPNLQDRFIVGAGSGYSPGNTGGANSVQLQATEMPVHSHSITDPGHDHQQRNRAERSWGGSSGDASPNSRGTPGADPNNPAAYRTFTATTGITATNNAGGTAGVTQAHENRPPYYALAFIMRVS